MKNPLLMLCLLLPLSVSAAEKQRPIDNALDSCMNKTSTTLGMTQCYDAAYHAWDKEMNAAYQAALAKRDATQKQQLRTAQRNWLTYRASWMTAAKGYVLKQQGTMAGLTLGAQNVELVKQQALMLKSLNSACGNPDDC
ncbi:DUF1311 domain-containing protein [Paramixta manurensis]|uniref:DUF1311 domain-containing protein n=1 Tax=Paramixta manurensis TaxID=2740817 RepID=A0A6M8UUL2_9GAMM|nr:DUF1311 domain-containing protein [Erwiniaceae bacterium PD-1]